MNSILENHILFNILKYVDPLSFLNAKLVNKNWYLYCNKIEGELEIFWSQDISLSSENIKIPIIINSEEDEEEDINRMKFPYFKYITSVCGSNGIDIKCPVYVSTCKCDQLQDGMELLQEDDQNDSSLICHCIIKSGGINYLDDGTLSNRVNDYIYDEISLSYPVFECNDSCFCDVNKCSNRATQCGIQCKLYIKSLKKKGYGLFAGEPIRKNTFVIEYIGEITRRKNYVNKNSQNYLLIANEVVTKRDYKNQNNNNINDCNDENINDDDTTTTLLKKRKRLNEEGFEISKKIQTKIDAKNKGNAARFVNHSCNPNMMSLFIRSGSIIPRICFFSNRFIEKDEELTISYGIVDENDVDNLLVCLCNEDNCIGYLPYEPNV